MAMVSLATRRVFSGLVALLLTSLTASAAAGAAGASGKARELALEDAWSRELEEPDTKVVKYKSPIQRVVSLLKKMQGQLMSESDKESDMYDKMACWCETNEKEKTKAIADADTTISDLQSEIESRSGSNGGGMVEIAALKKQIAADKAALAQATAIREKEAGAFSDEEKESIQAVTNLKNAILVLSRHHESSFMQLDAPTQASLDAVLQDLVVRYELMQGDSLIEVHGGLRRSAAASLLAVGTRSKEGLGAALRDVMREQARVVTDDASIPVDLAQGTLARAARQAATGPASGAFVQAAAPYQSYASRSGDILGILKQMKDEFESNLSEAQKDDIKGKADYEALVKSKTEQIEAGQVKLDSLEVAQADNAKALSDAKENMELSRKQRTADVEFLSNLRLTCQGLDKEWADRSSTRSEELKAVSEAIAILTEDDAADLMRKTVTLLQEHMTVVSELAKRRASAARLLHRAARAPQLESDDLFDAWRGRGVGAAGGAHAQLATLAMSVQLDNFTVVKEAMDKMVADLKSQQQAEVETKELCEKEFDENEKTTFAKTQQLKDLEGKLEVIAANSEKLNEEIDDAKKQIVDTQVAIKEASATREKENAAFQEVVGDQRATQAVLAKAIKRLDLFYKKAGSEVALLQHNIRAKQTPPVQFNAYNKNAGSTSVIGLLKQIVEDSKKLEAEATAGEAKAQADYESFVKDSNAILAGLTKAVSSKQALVASATVESEESKTAHEGTSGELEALAEYNADLHMQCDFLMKNFDIRQMARLQEIEAVQQAKAILSGAVKS